MTSTPSRAPSEIMPTISTGRPGSRRAAVGRHSAERVSRYLRANSSALRPWRRSSQDCHGAVEAADGGDAAVDDAAGDAAAGDAAAGDAAADDGAADADAADTGESAD